MKINVITTEAGKIISRNTIIKLNVNPFDIEGSGSLLSKGANGGLAWIATGGGGGGGGSITLYYATTTANLTMNATGGSGGSGSRSGGSGGAGGAGSIRTYSMTQLASHTRV